MTSSILSPQAFDIVAIDLHARSSSRFAMAALPPAQRPKRWQLCPELAPNPQGKWERQRWQRWAQDCAEA
jgi:hypothetical protein